MVTLDPAYGSTEKSGVREVQPIRWGEDGAHPNVDKDFRANLERIEVTTFEAQDQPVPTHMQYSPPTAGEPADPATPPEPGTTVEVPFVAPENEAEQQAAIDAGAEPSATESKDHKVHPGKA